MQIFEQDVEIIGEPGRETKTTIYKVRRPIDQEVVWVVEYKKGKSPRFSINYANPSRAGNNRVVWSWATLDEPENQKVMTEAEAVREELIDIIDEWLGYPQKNNNVEEILKKDNTND